METYFQNSMQSRTVDRLARSKGVVLAVLACATLTGCTTVAIYQNPIAQFQTAVNSANDSIRPYLLGVNSLIAKANLYDKIGMDRPWGTEDLNAGIPPAEIQVRLQALSTIARYANALATVANAKDVEQLGQAAKALGNDINGLSTTVQSLATQRTASPGSGASAKQATTLDLSGPVSSLVTLVGTLIIEQKQKAAIEKAILDGDKPVNQLIELLRTDLRALTLVDQTSYAAIRTRMVKLYDSARGKTDPKGLIALIDDLVAQNDRIVTLQTLQIDSLLGDMGSAQAALVAFAKSKKGPKDLSDLAAQIDVFTAHVKLFEEAIASVQSTVKNSK
jgi:hypothetical protein